jgi:hypothetical protein
MKGKLFLVGVILGLLILFGIVVKVVYEYAPTKSPPSPEMIDREKAAGACEGRAIRDLYGAPGYTFEPLERAVVTGAGTRASPWEVKVSAKGPPPRGGIFNFNCLMVKRSDGTIELLQFGCPGALPGNKKQRCYN